MDKHMVVAQCFINTISSSKIASASRSYIFFYALFQPMTHVTLQENIGATLSHELHLQISL